MPLSQTPQGVEAGLLCQYCPNLPAGQQFIRMPLPGAKAGPWRCPHPCGRKCTLQVGACPPPPPLPREFEARLRLPETRARLRELLSGRDQPERVGRKEADGFDTLAVLAGALLVLN